MEESTIIMDPGAIARGQCESALETILREGGRRLLQEALELEVQQYVEHDPKRNYYNFGDGYANQLKTIACFDLVANSTDRKANHMLEDVDGKLWSIDHGLTFHPLFKLRTVMLEFWGQPIPEQVLGDLESLRSRLESRDGLSVQLAEMLAPQEVQALKGRLQAVLEDPVLLTLDPYRNVPWPWV